jgi:hypothetical protein|tara:strand:+ start:278 stop:679 length:402 start_codon:yes stop_codon:yes gene_type:complete
VSNNTVTASIGFDFKGQHFSLSTEIDIDNIIYHEDFFSSVYLTIARDNNIDIYSYQFEIMTDQNIAFSNGNGCVIGCIINGELDMKLLRESHQTKDYLTKIDIIIRQHIPPKKRCKEISIAMKEAYLLGKKSS